MSWWDYGYQITAMANRTILVDNNTWNNTHISRVGQVGFNSTILPLVNNSPIHNRKKQDGGLTF